MSNDPPDAYHAENGEHDSQSEDRLVFEASPVRLPGSFSREEGAMLNIPLSFTFVTGMTLISTRDPIIPPQGVRDSNSRGSDPYTLSKRAH